MARNTEIINVIDVEATCWDGQPPEDQKQEIIEVGVAELVVATGDIQNISSYFVQPELSEVSEFCTELTGIASSDLEDAPLFQDVCETLYQEHQSDRRVFASWGDFDYWAFQEDHQNKGLRFPFVSHLNVKTLDALDARLTSEKGLKTALRRRSIDFEGHHHRAGPDAHNTAKVLRDIL